MTESKKSGVRRSRLNIYGRAIRETWQIPEHELAKMKADMLDAPLNGDELQRRKAAKLWALIESKNANQTERTDAIH